MHGLDDARWRWRISVVTIDCLILRIADFNCGPGARAHAAIRQHGVRRRHVDGFHFGSAKRQRNSVVQRRVDDAHDASKVDDFLAPERGDARLMVTGAARPVIFSHFQRQPYRRRVQRALQRVEHRDAPRARAAIIIGAPIADADR